MIHYAIVVVSQMDLLGDECCGDEESPPRLGIARCLILTKQTSETIERLCLQIKLFAVYNQMQASHCRAQYHLK